MIKPVILFSVLFHFVIVNFPNYAIYFCKTRSSGHSSLHNVHWYMLSRHVKMKGYYIATVGVLTYCTHHAIQGSFTVDHVPLSVSTQRCWEYHHRLVHCGQKLCLASFVPSGHHVAREGSLPNLAMFVSWANCELLNALLRLWTDVTSIPALHMNITVPRAHKNGRLE